MSYEVLCNGTVSRISIQNHPAVRIISQQNESNIEGKIKGIMNH